MGEVMNLALKSDEYRASLEADKAAHFIRHRCIHLEGWQRQVCARKMLDGYPEKQRELIEASMKKIAGKV